MQHLCGNIQVTFQSPAQVAVADAMFSCTAYCLDAVSKMFGTAAPLDSAAC